MFQPPLMQQAFAGAASTGGEQQKPNQTGQWAFTAPVVTAPTAPTGVASNTGAIPGAYHVISPGYTHYQMLGTGAAYTHYALTPGTMIGASNQAAYLQLPAGCHQLGTYQYMATAQPSQGGAEYGLSTHSVSVSGHQPFATQSPDPSVSSALSLGQATTPTSVPGAASSLAQAPPPSFHMASQASGTQAGALAGSAGSGFCSEMQHPPSAPYGISGIATAASSNSVPVAAEGSNPAGLASDSTAAAASAGPLPGSAWLAEAQRNVSDAGGPASVAGPSLATAGQCAASLSHALDIESAGGASQYGLASLAWAGSVLQGDGIPNSLGPTGASADLTERPLLYAEERQPPKLRKTEVPAARLRKVLAFIQRVGRRPTRKSRDPAEKTLGTWLHRFICNDDGVKDRASAALPQPEFDFIMRAIETAPDAKQVADKAIALANIEAIAERALQLRAVPLRGDVSGCGKKLHNIRQVGSGGTLLTIILPSFSQPHAPFATCALRVHSPPTCMAHAACGGLNLIWFGLAPLRSGTLGLLSPRGGSCGRATCLGQGSGVRPSARASGGVNRAVRHAPF